MELTVPQIMTYCYFNTYWPVSKWEFSWQTCWKVFPSDKAWRATRLDTPGRVSGSYVTADVQSVTDFFTFSTISSAESVSSILLLGSGCDLDIFFAGSRRLLTLFFEGSVKNDVYKLKLFYSVAHISTRINIFQVWWVTYLWSVLVFCFNI